MHLLILSALFAGSDLATRAVLDFVTRRWESLEGLEDGDSPNLEDGQVPASVIESAATAPQTAEPLITSAALLTALKSSPDLDIAVSSLLPQAMFTLPVKRC